VRYWPITEMRLPEVTKICARCKGHYVDDEDGIKAHVVVHGHRPPKGAP
jgi:hypothetical protein